MTLIASLITCPKETSFALREGKIDAGSCEPLDGKSFVGESRWSWSLSSRPEADKNNAGHHRLYELFKTDACSGYT